MPLNLHRLLSWNPRSRTLVFLLASASILCLLADFYGLCPMRLFALAILLPATIALGWLAWASGRYSNGELRALVVVGAVAGLIAAVSYDIFRLPFVFSREWGLESVVPPMQLFKTFPRFGAMLLAQPLEQAHYSGATQVLGWFYHFGNGAAFGVMYVALAGSVQRHWIFGVAFALGIELGMLMTPYPNVFGIPITPHFVAVTIVAHAIFGFGLALSAGRIAAIARPVPLPP